MKDVYDTYYQTKDLFGEPFAELIAFFKEYTPKGKVLDLGCGQGRNAIPLAHLGYDVLGLDSSKVGIDQMIKSAQDKGLNVTGEVNDLYAFDNYAEFDVILLDSMFHFTKNDLKKETGLIKTILTKVNAGTSICFCIQETGEKVNILKTTIEESNAKLEVLHEKSMMYKFEDKESGHTSSTKYCMLVVYMQ